MDISLVSSIIKTIKTTTIKYLKNGFYIPILYGLTYYLKSDILFSTIVAVKLYPTNFFYWFGHKNTYENIPKQYNFVKQFIRFTDTGHVVSFFYLIDPSIIALAHNIHFLITFGFWSGQYLGMRDADNREDPEIVKWYQNGWSYYSHGIPYLLFLRQIIISEECVLFDFNNIWLSYLWLYSWFFMVYIPWRFYTGDVVYTILSFDVPIRKRLQFIGLIHILLLVANSVGYIVSRM